MFWPAVHSFMLENRGVGCRDGSTSQMPVLDQSNLTMASPSSTSCFFWAWDLSADPPCILREFG